MQVEKGEIVLCDLKVIHKNKIYEIKDVIYKNVDGMFYRKRHLDTLKIYESVKVHSVVVLKRLGFESKAKGYTEVKKSDSSRNKITGTYD